MIRDPETVQRELDAAQADLERHVGELKHFVEHKLERPKQVIGNATHAIAVAKKPFAWVDAHTLVAALGALAIGAALGLLAAHRRAAQRRGWFGFRLRRVR